MRESNHYRYLCTLIAFVVLSLMLLSSADAGVGVSPKVVIYNPGSRSMPITISNPSDDNVEISVSAVIGYVTSNDTGASILVYDSTDATIPSAARWIQFYPTRFFLGPHEAQIVRLVATPPPGTRDGEYWARLIFASQSSKAFTKLSKNSGMIVIHRIAIPFHYRVGQVSTGLEVSDLRASGDDKHVTVRMNTIRTGNAAYWGSVTVRLVNRNGVVVKSRQKDVAVYRTYVVKVDLERENIPPGDYRVDVKFETNSRKDVADTKLVQAAPIIMRTDVSLP